MIRIIIFLLAAFGAYSLYQLCGGTTSGNPNAYQMKASRNGEPTK
jgi:hypothetical protein